MKRILLATAAALALSIPGANAAVYITEIMYNPSGSFDPGTAASSAEWVEIYNDGAAPVDVSGWLLDDEDATAWGALPAGSTLLPGEVAVITTNPTEFTQAWGSGIKTFGVTWQSLANSATDINEVLVIRDSGGNIVDEANYQAGANGWPISSNGRSIYLGNVFLSNDIGSNWALSEPGVDGAFSPGQALDPFAITDVGSPGFVPVPEPTSLSLILLGLVGLGVFRRR